MMFQGWLGSSWVCSKVWTYFGVIPWNISAFPWDMKLNKATLHTNWQLLVWVSIHVFPSQCRRGRQYWANNARRRKALDDIQHCLNFKATIRLKPKSVDAHGRVCDSASTPRYCTESANHVPLQTSSCMSNIKCSSIRESLRRSHLTALVLPIQLNKLMRQYIKVCRSLAPTSPDWDTYAVFQIPASYTRTSLRQTEHKKSP